MWKFKEHLLRTENQPIISCNETTQSGGAGVTEYVIDLDKPNGGIIIMDFNAFNVVDKLEIIHNGIKKATSGMTTANAGPFDDLYGNPTIPTGPESTATDQFIGLSKGAIPTRDSDFLTETGITDVTRTKQQLIWWVYSNIDYDTNNTIVIRVTGPTGTGWDLKRLCTAQIPTGVTPPSVLSINSSVPAAGVGTLDFEGGQSFEVLGLSFVVTDDIDFTSLQFDSPVSVPMLDPLHLTRTGSVTLDASGNASSTYTFDPSTTNSSCVVTITSRSSGAAIPSPNSTNIMN